MRRNFRFWEKGVKDTIEILEKAGIAWYGLNGKELHLDIKGEKVCFGVFFCYSTNMITSVSDCKINILNNKNVFHLL